ncbi:hypothetical protein ANO14919_073970 [Xylariales sp. No.14919]|nr:hypothetical protein ANO14919_073970 [Xylariales sp. No.14919]
MNGKEFWLQNGTPITEDDVHNTFLQGHSEILQKIRAVQSILSPRQKHARKG